MIALCEPTDGMSTVTLQHQVNDASEFAECVADLALPAPWVVGLPWAAMSIAADIAGALQAPLDMLLIRAGGGGEPCAPGRPQVLLLGRSVVLVDDGSTAAVTLVAALQALRCMRPHSVTLVSPMPARSIDAALAAELDHLVCLVPQLRLTMAELPVIAAVEAAAAMAKASDCALSG